MVQEAEDLIPVNNSSISKASQECDAADGMHQPDELRWTFPSAKLWLRELKPWEHNAICTLPKSVAEKRSNNKLKSWPNIRCRVRAEVWNDYEKKKQRGSRMREGRGGEEEEEKKSCTVRLDGHLRNPRSAGKCLLSYGIALEWYVPEGKESHFVCITLKRSQEAQTGMRELVNHRETRGLKRRSERGSALIFS